MYIWIIYVETYTTLYNYIEYWCEWIVNAFFAPEMIPPWTDPNHPGPYGPYSAGLLWGKIIPETGWGLGEISHLDITSFVSCSSCPKRTWYKRRSQLEGLQWRHYLEDHQDHPTFSKRLVTIGSSLIYGISHWNFGLITRLTLVLRNPHRKSPFSGPKGSPVPGLQCDAAFGCTILSGHGRMARAEWPNFQMAFPLVI